VDAPVPLIGCALLAAGVLAGRTAALRAWCMLGAVALTAVVLGWHVWDNGTLDRARDHPSVIVVAVAAGLAAVAVLAAAFHRWPALLPLAAVAALPFRIPIASGPSTSNLLVPLYLVIGAGAVAYAVPRLGGRGGEDDPQPGWLERVLALVVVLYAVQSTYSSDFSHALENVVFFYVPFALLFVLLVRVRWTPRLALECLGVLVALSLVFVGIGFVEYGTKHLLLNPKVIASNQFESYFRVNSLFFDPNIYGRFLALVMAAVAAVVIWTRRPREVAIGAGLLAVLWAGLVLTFSQSSFVALLVALAVLGGMRWSVKWAWTAVAGAVVVAVVFVAAAPSAIHLDIGDSKSADTATSGRYDLIKGGLDLFGDAPVVGQGSGSFAREYRRAQQSSNERAASASHTIPVTVAAEQGVLGLGAYLALLAVAFALLFGGARARLERAALAALFCALVVHTMMYAAFLEDPLTWAILAAGAAFARLPKPPRTRRERPDETSPETAEPAPA
jgi:O-antigen ligase